MTLVGSLIAVVKNTFGGFYNIRRASAACFKSVEVNSEGFSFPYCSLPHKLKSKFVQGGRNKETKLLYGANV